MIIANLGRVRPVKFKDAGDDPRQKPHFHEDSGHTVELKTENLGEVVTDQAGKFPQGGPANQKGGMSYGEEHNLKSELEKQALQRVCAAIGEIVAREGFPAWNLVVPQPIMPRVLKGLPQGARDSLSNTIAGDLTHLPIAELEKRFLTGH